ncbi:ribulose 1,5-bisphosphate carboxylase large subunit [bacterium]|nr:ribulose 1,5-bisphosphate carboxylase large subunit [bacterium]MBU0899583.1 ribulose 1,5-bisphosphate carboxylase large subunit [bacterium]MBU1153096.1 ribulose 1,5-bisphosphate carboxylase large subunit [bacterium]MBU1782709.1 ribulose 1,5-bisphosphate carboxylase large subunit [bacterium]
MKDQDQFFVTYQIKASKDQIEAIANDICLEQTVEVIEELIQDSWIKENIIGQVKKISQVSANIFEVMINYHHQITGYQLPQLMSILYGNISLKASIKVVNISLSKELLAHFSGPRFGIEGIRKILGVKDRPLIAAALKPMGKGPKELAEFSYKLSLGGVDFIKDDHGLVDHPFCPFKERVKRCLEAINKAEIETGKKVIYLPNITDRYEKMLAHIKWAKEMGIGGILISPLIVGLDFMRYLAENKDLSLPIMAHPAFVGTLFNLDSGFSHEVILGDLMRLAGADLVIYPNYGGRFPFSKEVCQRVDLALKKEMGNLKQAFPVIAGGLDIENIGQLKEFYGHEVVFLIGSSLYAYSNDLVVNVKHLLKRVKSKE